jgi:hypothetical protein
MAQRCCAFLMNELTMDLGRMQQRLARFLWF